VKLVVGVVVALALLISGVAYLLLVKWSSTGALPVASHEGAQSVETVLLRSGEPTRTDAPWLNGYMYEVRFYDARDNETADVAASIGREPGAAIQYRLTVDLAHHVETWWLRADGDPSTTHLEWLSLTFNFSRPIPVNLQDLWLLTPIRSSLSGGSFSSSFSLESRFVDTEDLRHRILLLNLTQLRNVEMPPMSPVRWSWFSFQFLMTPNYPEPSPPYFEPFTLEISFALHRVLDRGTLLLSHYEKATTKPLEFQLPPAGLTPEPTGPEVPPESEREPSTICANARTLGAPGSGFTVRFVRG